VPSLLSCHCFSEIRRGDDSSHTDRTKSRTGRRRRTVNLLEVLRDPRLLNFTPISQPNPTDLATTKIPYTKDAKKNSKTSQSPVDFLFLLCSLFVTDYRNLDSGRIPTSQGKPPRNPSGMLISHLSCGLYLEPTDEIRADIQGLREGIVGDSLAVGIRCGRRFHWDYTMAVRRVRIAISRRVVRGSRSVPARPRSSKTPFECVPRESGQDAHRHQVAGGLVGPATCSRIDWDKSPVFSPTKLCFGRLSS
jgi:hypothetical protein